LASKSASVPFRNSHSLAAYSHANFGIKGTPASLMILVWLLDLKFLYELAAIMEELSNPPH
jgi:hypothetical protein